jgi:pyruvate kinase
MDIQTKIIATIGPATLEPAIFQKLVQEGIDYARINTAYGDANQYDKILSNVIEASKTKPVQIMLDIKSNDILEYAKSNNITCIALSFAETVEQIKNVRAIIPNAFVISKIESLGGVKNFDQILDFSDGIMVARGDLGEAVSLEKVPPLQREFTFKTLTKEKFLVAATEMLLSMVSDPTPTRAEVSDVANAVFDHCSAVMLSEETAIGKFPIESVAFMRKIIIEAENWNSKNTKN